MGHRETSEQDSGAALDRGWQRRQILQTISRFSRNPSGMVGLLILLVMVVVHVGAPLFTNVDPAMMNASEILQAPSADHLFGTDQFGRDLLSRTLYGGRISLLVGFIVTGATAITGLAIGLVAGFYPRIDGPIMRAMDILMGFPTIILAIAIVAILGPGLSNIIIALLFPVTPRTARILRSVVLSLKEQEFVVAAQSVGATDLRIMLGHLVPNIMPALLVRQTYVFGLAILSEAGLSFLGIGAPPDVPALGSMVAEGTSYLRASPWFSFYSGLFIALVVLSVNLLGDGLRDVLDPRMR